MRVLSVAYPLAPVSRDAVGGAEQVLAALDAALVNAGHHSMVIACEQSYVRGELLAIPRVSGSYDQHAMRIAHEHCRRAIGEALTKWSIDVVHMHGVDFHEYLPPAGVSVLATLHLPVSWYPPQIFHSTRQPTLLNCVSEAQHRDCPACEYLLPPIPNGVEIPFVRRSKTPEYALAMGRICPEKGFHLALEAASRAGIPLAVAGRVFPYEPHERYFQAEVQPRLGSAHRFLGPVGHDAKLQLYANARCLVVASTVPETSSLAALEALACGTPVVAFRNGALPEIIADGKTGFLVNSVDEMAAGIRRAPEINPEECRRAVRGRFSIERMTARYLDVYRDCSPAGESTLSRPAMPAPARV